MVGLYAGDINDQVNAHGAGKVEFNGVCSNQLRDGIGAKPPFRQLPGGTRETEIVCQKPDSISYGICRGVQVQPVCLGEDA